MHSPVSTSLKSLEKHRKTPEIIKDNREYQKYRIRRKIEQDRDKSQDKKNNGKKTNYSFINHQIF
jgi:hypothetical protein